ncbi:MAG: sigma-54-dependent Fis family transcriptional regulator [Calditrichaeota bacterium]|nr:MAG: sigma-54-dependent Fis family transcriptional regulator [Calditrichota bacterium]
MKTRLLIVDDEHDALTLMQEIFRRKGYETFTAHDGIEALNVIENEEPDILISDLLMPNMDGMELLQEVRRRFPHISVIVVTAHGTIETAVEAMKKGAHDYILKPIHLDEILTKVSNLARTKHLIRENQQLLRELKEKYSFDNIIGRTPQMQKLFDMVRTVAPTPSTVLITGESGTGKELIANAIHYYSPRAGKDFVKVNCGALAETLLESELFGHVKGAFTGAFKDKPGRFEMAHGGTIFLDEIGDISPALQVKLLRVLQEREFERVGGTETIKVDVRVIAATNQNLEDLIKEGKFREDLYYRLNVITLHVPPLRERAEDIPLIVAHFISRFNKEFNKNVKAVDEEAMRRLQAYPWPGNVRQLINIVERTIILSQKEILGVEDFPEEIMQTNSVPSMPIKTDRPLNELVDEYEKQIILKALAENNHNKLRTAKKLGIHRSTFMSKLKKYGIN